MSIDSTLTFVQTSLPATRKERTEFLGLAERASDGVGSGYLRPRLLSYHHVHAARVDDRLSAFILTQTFEAPADDPASQCLHVYLGPLFSAGGHFPALFVHVIESYLAGVMPFWVAFEIQNPRVMEAFRLLLPRSGLPREGHPSPPATSNAAKRFATHLSHIRLDDPIRLTTRCTESPFGRGEAAPAQMVMLAWDGSPRERERISNELATGLRLWRQASRTARTSISPERRP